MGRGFTDEAVVAIKFLADEDMVTYLRVKLENSFRKIKVKGGIIQGELMYTASASLRSVSINEESCEERVKCN
jgi:hypothetical protein